MQQAEFSSIITDSIGLHARPAAITVNEANKFQSEIKIFSNGAEANLKSIMNVLALAIRYQQEFKVVAKGPDAQAAVEAVEQTMRTNKLIS